MSDEYPLIISAFYSCKLMKKLLENIFLVTYYKAQIKSRNFSSRKQNEGNLK